MAVAAVLFGVACLSALLILISRDTERFGEGFILSSSGMWVFAAAAGAVRAWLAPETETVLIGFGVGAVYLLVIVLTAGHPARMLAPYDRNAQMELSEKEFRSLYAKGWVLALAVLLGLFGYFWVVDSS